MGTIVFTLGIGANLQYALDDYGIMTNVLHEEVIAQCEKTIGIGSTTGGTLYKKETKNCLYRGTAMPFQTVFFGPGLFAIADWTGNWEFIYYDKETTCTSGGDEPCSPQNCPFLGTTT